MPGRRQERPCGRNFPAKAMVSGSAMPRAPTRSICCANPTRTGCPNWFRSSLAACRKRRLLSVAAPRVSWRQTSREPRQLASMSKPPAIVICSISAASPPRNARSSSTSTISMKPCLRHGTGTSRVLSPPSRSPRGRTACRMMPAAMPRLPARAAIVSGCGNLPNRNRCSFGIPASPARISSACSPRRFARSSWNGSKKPPANRGRNWTFPRLQHP